MLNESFSLKLNKISNDLSMNPRDLLLVMFLESGVNPAAVNPNGKATGLIQFMPSTLRDMGLSSNEIRNFGKKSAEDQLDYVKQYVQAHRGLIGGKPFTSATQYYIANYYPIALQRWHGSSPIKNANVVVTRKNAKDPNERAAYSQNIGLDSNKDGVITVSDITTVLMNMERTPKFQQMLSQFNSIAGKGRVSERRSRRPIRRIPEEKSMISMFLDKLMGLMDKLSMTSKININKYK